MSQSGGAGSPSSAGASAAAASAVPTRYNARDAMGRPLQPMLSGRESMASLLSAAGSDASGGSATARGTRVGRRDAGAASGSSTSRSSHPQASSDRGLASIFQASAARRQRMREREEAQARRSASPNSDEEEKTSPERQQRVRMRGRYSKEHMAELGQVFSSSELGRDREWGIDSSFAFDPERADALSGSHFHRPQGVSLAALRPAGYEPVSVSAGGRASSASAAAAPTFATEEDASPRSNLGIGSFGLAKPSSASASSGGGLQLSSGGTGQNARVAETTGKTIWQMWQRMKQDRMRAHQREMEREVVPSSTRQQQQQQSASAAAAAAASAAASSIDYVEAGKHIALQLSRAGVAVSHNHLDVIHNLAGLEKVWLQASEGLDENEFVAFLREVLRLPAEELSILFQKMDANADGSLSWDEYLSYLLIEVTHHWQFRSARGTWHLRDVDAPATACHAQVQQILVLPRDSSSPAAAASLAGQPKYVLSCKDNSIQVWNAASMSYQCHLPPAWTKNGGPTDAATSRGAIMGLGGGVTSSGYGISSGAASGSGAGADDAVHRPQTHRIGERRAGAGLRQKRCGGGGWKEDSSSALTGRHAVAGANGAPGSIEESLQRRAMHAGLARLSLANKDGSSSARHRFGLGSGGAAGAAGEGLDEWGSPLANQNAADDDDGSHGHGGGADGELGSNPFSRPRQSQGVLHTTVVYYPNQKQLLVASMDKSIHVYQQAFRQFVQVDRSEVKETPQCLTVHSQLTAPSSFQSNPNTNSLTNDLLIVGDTAGKCSAYHLPFSRDLALAGLEKAASGGGNSISGGLIGDRPGIATSMGGVGTPGGQASMPSLVAPFGSGAGLMGSAAAAAFNSRFAWSFQVHAAGETVRKVAVIPTVGLVSAGMDAKLHISDLSTRQVVRSLLGHKRGVYAFAHCESHRCIFSAGFDSKVLVFDPYLPHPTGSLAGHHGSILDVVVNSRRNQIITTCADKKIKVFDIRTMKLIQSLADNQEYAPYDQLSAVAFDQEQQQLVTAGNKLRLWPVIIAPGNKARRGGPAHSNLVVAICFSKVFQQIVSISVDESVHLWDIYTGRSVFEFRTNHGSPLTAACLDHRGKRLLTGAHDGSVSMWNFHNGAKMSDFPSRGKELIQLLYLPRTLQCVVGIGWERHVVRWPDPNAPKNTKWLVQSDHRAEVSCVAFFQSILVTAASDGEIIVWYMDSALVSKRLWVPLTPGKSKRPGVTKMTFVDFPSGFVVLLAGTDDGSLHFIKLPGSAETIFSLFEIFPEPIQGMAVNRVKETGARTRLMVVDCQVDAKLFDLSGIRGTASSNTVGLGGPADNDEIRSLPCLKQWEPHPLATSTDLIAIDDIDCFASSSDTGDITLWSLEGEQRCKFAQRKSWPIADPRTASHRETGEDADRKKQGAGAAGAGAQPERSSGGSSSDDDDDDEDDDASDEEGARSSEWGSGDESGRPGLSRKQSQLSTTSSRSGTSSRGGLKKQASGSGGGKKSRRRSNRDRATSPSAHRKPEPSFAESHPKFIPRDETSKYLKEHAQQVAMDAAAARAAKEAAAAEAAAAAAAQASGRKHGGKLPLAEMLNKLETDLKHAHSTHAHSHSHAAHSQHAADAVLSSGSSGAHIYDRYSTHSHTHHSSGSQQQAGHASIHFSPTAAQGSAAASANFDPLADLSPTPSSGAAAFAYPGSGSGSVTSRGPRRSDETSMAGAAGSSTGASTARLSRPRPPVSFSPESSSAPAVRVGLSQGSRTISNSDVFTQPSPAMSRLLRRAH